MAEANEEPRCSFQWEISNPFLPWRTLETSFFHATPTISHWTVTFQSTNRSFNPLRFSFCLEFSPWWDPPNEVVVDNIVISINLNGASIAQRDVPNYRFSHQNHFEYDFQGMTVVYPQIDPDHLVIKIQIFFSGQGNQEGNGLISDEDLESLSGDLEKLLYNPQYSDLTLVNEGLPYLFQVHTFIMDERWDEFARLHPYNAADNEAILTNMSRNILMDILTYVYSGNINIDWNETAYVTELFQVIYQYKLYHLYKVFVKDDLLQLRVSRTPILINSRQYPLLFSNGSVIGIESTPWVVNRGHKWEFMIRMGVTYNGRSGPWLAYQLKSLSVFSLDVRVYLDVSRKVGDSFQRVSFVHQRDFRIDCEDRVESGPILFLGSLDLFCTLDSNSYIGCFLSITDGTTLEKLQSLESATLQSDAERFEVLSNHMYRSRQKDKRGDDSCMFISGFTANNSNSRDTHVHKAIFACRVPEYWEVLEGIAEAGELVQSVHCDYSEEAIVIIISYIYTGKVGAIPQHLLGDIRRFAERSRFISLQRLVDRIQAGSA